MLNFPSRRSAVALLAVVVFGTSTIARASAESLSEESCDALGTAFDVLLEHNKQVLELGLELAERRFELKLYEPVTENPQEDTAVGSALEIVTDRISDMRPGTDDIIPGILVWRRLCRDD